jgi:CheY-like chemotaxis protein
MSKMDELSKFITALSSLAWPVIFGACIYLLRFPIVNLIESARARKFTLKVAGNELTMEESSEQQRVLISDLQTKVAELEKLVKPVGVGTESDVLPSEPTRSSKRILWVDDEPRNNSYLVAALEDQGLRVDTAQSTNEALSKINKDHFDIIISDMGRPEGRQAGIDLIKTLRTSKIDIPVYIFCGSYAANAFRERAIDAGAAGITSSGTTLMSMLPL